MKDFKKPNKKNNFLALSWTVNKDVNIHLTCKKKAKKNMQKLINYENRSL